MATDTQFVRGADKLQARIATIRRNLNLPAFITEIGALLERRTQDRFEREVDPDGRPWQPLAASTIERKRKNYAGRKILQRTGALKNAIKQIRGGAGTVYTNTGAGIRIGVEDPQIARYARIHNTGLPGRIPARQFLGIGRLDVKAVDSLLRRKAVELERS